jgi:Serine/threonine protein kinase
MLHSSTTTHKSINLPASSRARGLIHNSSSGSSNSNSIDSGTTTTTKTTKFSSTTPLANFVNKLNIWKKRSNSNLSDTVRDKDSRQGERGSEQMFPRVDHRTGRRPERARPAPERKFSKPRTRSSSSSSQGKNTHAIDYSESVYNQVVDGMNKMRPTSGDDYTVGTSSITHVSSYSGKPTLSSSLDDGSTIVSEMTTDSSYAFHSFQVDKHTFTVDKRYSMIRTIGSGAYGVVISAKDFTGGTNVAIKMIPKAFHDEIDAKRILREIKLLKHFKHENIISIQDMMPPLAKRVEDFRDVYIVSDLMETDLHRIIYSKQDLSIDHVQYFIYQVLRAVKYMHSANVLHRDLKPSNLLVNSNCDLKVCDFGLARGISATHDQDLENEGNSTLLLTEYVVTRWYRAPEIMLACHEYSKPIDIWSVGCIFAELLGRKPFLAGDDYIHQVSFKLMTSKLAPHISQGIALTTDMINSSLSL